MRDSTHGRRGLDAMMRRLYERTDPARGYSEADLTGIAGGNILRVMRGAEAAATRIQAARPPSEATIESLGG